MDGCPIVSSASTNGTPYTAAELLFDLLKLVEARDRVVAHVGEHLAPVVEALYDRAADRLIDRWAALG